MLGGGSFISGRRLCGRRGRSLCWSTRGRGVSCEEGVIPGVTIYVSNMRVLSTTLSKMSQALVTVGLWTMRGAWDIFERKSPEIGKNSRRVAGRDSVAEEWQGEQRSGRERFSSSGYVSSRASRVVPSPAEDQKFYSQVQPQFVFLQESPPGGGAARGGAGDSEEIIGVGRGGSGVIGGHDVDHFLWFGASISRHIHCRFSGSFEFVVVQRTKGFYVYDTCFG